MGRLHLPRTTEVLMNVFTVALPPLPHASKEQIGKNLTECLKERDSVLSLTGVVSSEWWSLTTNDDVIMGITAEFTMFLVTASSKILIGNFSFCPSHVRLHSPIK